MARGKKKESTLTPEEKMAQALVPDWEQPYKVPGNWCWVKLSALSALISKGTTPTGGKNAYVSEGIHFLRVENINDDGTISHDNIACVTEEMHTGFLKRSMLKNRDVLVSIAGTLGKTGIVRDIDLPLNTNQAVAFIRLKSENVNECYIKGVIDNPITQELLLGKTKVTSIPNLTLEIIGDCPIPLAPIAEQCRIVNRIEYLFDKLDEAREKAQSVLDGFETRKAAILHKAFTGELTAKWRADHGVGLENWKHIRFDVVAEIKSNLVDPADYQNFPHIAPDNIEKKTGVLLEYHTIAEDGVTSGKHRFYPGQILYSKIRPYLSKVIVVDFDGLCSADMYPIEAKQDARCLWYYMLSEEFLEQASSAGSRSVLPKINQKELSALMVNLPSNAEEQHEIVRILDSLFAKEQQAREAAEAVLERIDLLKKSILARAFRGELGTNDPSEESALELLKQVLQKDAPSVTRKRSKSISKDLKAKLNTELERSIIKLYFKTESDTLPVNELLSVSSKKFEIMNTLRLLEQRKILTKLPNGKYRLLE